MAGGTFRRFIEIVLDRASAAKAERDTREALNRATDPRGARRNLSSINDLFRTTTRLVAEAAAAVVGYGLALTKLADRGGQVIAVAQAFTRVVGDQEAALIKLRKATQGLISDYDLMAGFNRAVTLGAAKTVDEFAELADVAINLGRALGVDAGHALESLTIGIGRQSRLVLDNIGLIVKVEEANERYADSLGKTVDELTQVEQKEAFRTAAMEAARKKLEELGRTQETNAQLLGRIRTLYQNIRDEIGKLIALSPTLRLAFFETGNVLETILLAFQSDAPENIREAFKRVGEMAGTAFGLAFFGALSKLPGWETLGLLGIPLEPLQRLGQAGADRAAASLDAQLTAFGAFRRELESAAELRARRSPITQVSELNEQEVQTAEQIRKAEDDRLKLLMQAHELSILNVEETKELFRIYEQAAHALREGNLTLEERLRLVDRLATVEPAIMASPTRKRVGGFRLPSMDQIQTRVSKPTGVQGGLVEELSQNLDEVTSAAQVAALGIQNAFEQAFLAIGQEGDGFADFFETLFEGMAGSVLSAIAQIASAKVAENIAYAVEALAKGLLFDNPKQLAAAGTFAKAAAAWAVVGGIAGAAASAAGGSTGGSFRGSDVTGRAVDQIDKAGPDIVLMFDGVDPKNPRHQALIGEASREYQQRYGGRIRVENQ